MSNNKYKILIVEDAANTRSFIKANLETSDYQVICAETCTLGIMMYASHHPDLIILDLGLPDRDGLDLIQEVRESDTVPIIVLSARSNERDKVTALDLGANDYITKPFSMPILVRKIGAVLRRSSMIPEQEHQTITYKNLVLDMDSYTAAVDGVSFDLTQREFEVLRELLLNQGRVLTRQNLLDKLWKYDFYGDERVVDTHIKNLRKKLGIDFIQTIRGVGYKIDKEN